MMTIFQSAWLQLDISPYSYQSYSVIALILFCLAVCFYRVQAILFSIIVTELVHLSQLMTRQ